MAKRGRRSIRNKRKSVKKYSSKCRSKTRRYLRGGMIRPHTSYQGMSELNEYRIKKEAEFDSCMKPCILITDNDDQDSCIKKCSISANPIDDDDDDMDGGRRRYYRRKQSKSRSRKH